jgi:hypothetical protein
MNRQKLSQQVMGALLITLLLVGCGASTATPIPPTDTPEPTSCEEVEGNCFMVFFDGENCMYMGPSIQEKGPVTLLFINNGDWPARVNLVRHKGEESIQNMIDYMGPEPSTNHAPDWAVSLGPWKAVGSGKRHTSEELLEPGIHTMVCADPRYGMWLGGGFTVEE